MNDWCVAMVPLEVCCDQVGKFGTREPLPSINFVCELVVAPKMRYDRLPMYFERIKLRSDHVSHRRRSSHYVARISARSDSPVVKVLFVDASVHGQRRYGVEHIPGRLDKIPEKPRICVGIMCRDEVVPAGIVPVGDRVALCVARRRKLARSAATVVRTAWAVSLTRACIRT